MSAKGFGSLALVEIVMFLEDVFEVHITDQDVETFRSEREIANRLEPWLLNQPPGANGVKILKNIAERERRPELISDLHRPWRREQITAVIGQLMKELP